ncbi:MAG TPA: PAS domain-containing protein [Cyclobacteriaceae bacterium]|nr:PAS domain-containing protein [Cyclobacteriaceae bacterium]
MDSIPFSSIVYDIPVGITVLRGPSFIVEMANPTYLQFVDKKEDEFVGKSLFEGLPEVREVVEPLLNDVYYKGIPYHGHEFPAPLKRHGSIEIGYFNFVYQPTYDSSGKINGVIVVANEVTPNVVARQKLAESERKFREIVMRSHMSMTIVLGEDFVIDIANQKLLDTLWRTTADKVIGKKLLEAFPELNDQRFPELLRQVYRDGVPHSESEAPVFIDGVDGMRKFYVDFVYEPLFDQLNKVFGIIVTVTDVTERVEYRKRIEEAEEKSRLAIESAQLGTYSLNFATNEVTVSDRYLEIWGLKELVSREEMIKLIEPADLAVRANAHEAALKTGHLNYEVRINRPDHKTCWIKAVGTVLRDKDGKPATLVGMIQDITEQKIFSEELERQVQLRTEELQAASEEITATNEELAETNNKLVTANFELEQFNYAASHDLQEPVRKIQTFVSYLTNEGSKASFERKSEYINKIKIAAERMKNIIDDLLLYARHTKTEKQLVPVDLNEVMTAVTSELDLMIEEKKATLEIETLPTISAISSQMHQLFRNLLSNSLKFTKPGVAPVIKVTSKQEPNERIHITFADNGIGFEQEFADYVFKLFKRLHPKSEYDGTGIGLSLCKKIMENHGGDIYAESVPNKGTTMHIILPSRS